LKKEKLEKLIKIKEPKEIKKESSLELLFLKQITDNDVLPLPDREYQFHPTRKWKIDFCWPRLKLAVEIEGGLWRHGRHNTPLGYIKDMEKYNEITRMGYKLFRFSGEAVKNESAINFIKEIILNNHYGETIY